MKNMNPVIEALTKAKKEITSLREINRLQAAKIEGMDLAAALLFARPQERGQAVAVDVVWELNQAIEQIERNTPRPAAHEADRAEQAPPVHAKK